MTAINILIVQRHSFLLHQWSGVSIVIEHLTSQWSEFSLAQNVTLTCAKINLPIIFQPNWCKTSFLRRQFDAKQQQQLSQFNTKMADTRACLSPTESIIKSKSSSEDNKKKRLFEIRSSLITESNRRTNVVFKNVIFRDELHNWTSRQSGV